MSKIVSIHQPQYLPWAPYFDKILRSDEFIFLDNVSYQKNGMQNRNKIKTANGDVWLTVPVEFHLGQLINETKIARPEMLKKHLKTLEMSYKKAPFYDEVMSWLGPILDRSYVFLSEVAMDATLGILRYLNYAGRVIVASTLKEEGRGSELVRNICLEQQASVYLSGQGGKNYMEMDDFKLHNIEVLFQEYRAVTYPQLYSKIGFIENLSIIDLLFNVGQESVRYIEEGRIM